MERAVVPEPRERIGLRLELEACTDVRIVEGERGCVAEPDGELELFLGELLQSDAVDVERALDAARAR